MRHANPAELQCTPPAASATITPPPLLPQQELPSSKLPHPGCSNVQTTLSGARSMLSDLFTTARQPARAGGLEHNGRVGRVWPILQRPPRASRQADCRQLRAPPLQGKQACRGVLNCSARLLRSGRRSRHRCGCLPPTPPCSSHWPPPTATCLPAARACRAAGRSGSADLRAVKVGVCSCIHGLPACSPGQCDCARPLLTCVAAARPAAAPHSW